MTVRLWSAGEPGLLVGAGLVVLEGIDDDGEQGAEGAADDLDGDEGRADAAAIPA